MPQHTHARMHTHTRTHTCTHAHTTLERARAHTHIAPRAGSSTLSSARQLRPLPAGDWPVSFSSGTRSQWAAPPAEAPPPHPRRGWLGPGNGSRGAGLAATPAWAPGRPPALGRATACAPGSGSGRRLRTGAALRASAASSGGAGSLPGPRRPAPAGPSPALPAPSGAGPGGDQRGDVKGERGGCLAGCRRAPAPGPVQPRAEAAACPAGPDASLRAAASGPARACAGESRATVPSGDRDRPRPRRLEPRGARRSPTDPRPRCQTS